MEKLKYIASIHISGKRWFRKSAGNTYSSVRLYITYMNRETDTLYHPRTGGYGDYYNQLALDLFRDKFEIPRDRSQPAYLSSFLRDLKIPYSIEVTDVSREKDL